MRGRTALYARRHLAQVVAIKRLQAAGHSLADIQRMWPTLDDATLFRLTGIELPKIATKKASRAEFWKKPPAAASSPRAHASLPSSPVSLRVDLSPTASLVLALPPDASLTPADIHAIRVAAGSLVTELANRGLIARAAGTLEEDV
jgi:hypothetical protein